MNDPLHHRKTDVRLTVLYPDGTKACNVPVQVDQTTHQFLFGCGAFDSVAMMKASGEQHTILQERMEKWLGLFNYATLPFYWGRYEPEEGKPVYPETRAAAEWLRSRGVQVKGHPLCWHTSCAPWFLKYSNEEILRRQLARIHRDVTAYSDVIDMWDVINETVIMPVFDRYDNAITRICRDIGRTPLIREVFSAARESNPQATLLINDFNTSPAYEHVLEELLAADVPISAIGIQSHQHQGFWGLEKLEDVLSRFSRFGLPVHFTENSLISGSLMPPHIVDLNDWQVERWPTTEAGEIRQAQEITLMYSTLFAHPSVEAITNWHFIDGCWLKAPSGFIRKDHSEKPSYEALRQLIHGAWETHTAAITDGDGNLSFTGFKGKYRLTCGKYTADFDSLIDNQQIILGHTYERR